MHHQLIPFRILIIENLKTEVRRIEEMIFLHQIIVYTYSNKVCRLVRVLDSLSHGQVHTVR